MPPPSPFGEGDKCLPDLGTQSQLLHPTVLGLDGNLSVGTVLSKGAGLRGEKPGRYNMKSPPATHSPRSWTHPPGVRRLRVGQEVSPSLTFREPPEAPDSGWSCFLIIFIKNSF